MPPQNPRADAITGCLLGTALGDSLGLPYEGMSRRRLRRWLAPGALGHRFAFGRGMLSDDTEHSCLVAHALALARGDTERFAQIFAWHLRWWFVGLPAGIGFGTLRALLKLWLGFSAARSGVRSAGNGPAMRAAVLGVVCAHDEAALARLVQLATRITHVDPRAEAGALAVAYAAASAARGAQAEPRELLLSVRSKLADGELAELVERAAALAESPSEDFADSLGLADGVTGFVLHTVPIALHVWARYPRDLSGGLHEVIRLGGDTDTTAAIVGGLIGAGTGVAGLPPAWVDGLAEWPRGVAWMRRLGSALASGSAPPSLRWPLAYLRNALFTLGIYRLILRRALPPY